MCEDIVDQLQQILIADRDQHLGLLMEFEIRQVGCPKHFPAGRHCSRNILNLSILEVGFKLIEATYLWLGIALGLPLPGKIPDIANIFESGRFLYRQCTANRGCFDRGESLSDCSIDLLMNLDHDQR